MNSVRNAPITVGTKVFVAADLDVPMENNQILDTFRLDCMLPTLNLIIEKGGFPIMGGHMGRPKGIVVPELSTQHLQTYFDQKLGVGKYQLLENLRFDPREELGDDTYTKELASLADIYVNEVFSTSHRNDCSITGIPKYLPAFAGLRLELEITNLKNLLTNPARPLIVVIGGAKLEDKKPAAAKFLEIADYVLLGGKIGKQWTEELPANLVVPTDYAEEEKDIGPETAKRFREIILTAKTVLWAGPIGKYQEPKFFVGSKIIAEAVAEVTALGAFSVAGGNDTSKILTSLGLHDKINFFSTGGGAMLKFLVAGTLPGVEALG